MIKIQLFFILLMILAGHFAIAQENLRPGTFILHGTVKNYPKKYIYLINYDNDLIRLRDSAVVTGGHFTFKGKVASYSQNVFIKSDPEQMENNDSVNAVKISMGNDIVSIELEYDHFSAFKMKGCKACDEANKFEQHLDRSGGRLYLYNDSLDVAKDTLEKLRLNKKIKQTEDKESRYIDNYLKVNSASPIVPYIVDRYSDDKATYQKHFTPTQKKSFYAVTMAATMASQKAAQVLGKRAYLFSAKDINGNSFSLDSLAKNGCVLLDFWFSSCGPCIRQIPALKALYQKYHAKGLSIVSISSDFFEKDWAAGIARDSSQQFIHCLVKNIPSNKYLKINYIMFNSKNYNVNYCPTFILIDKNGNTIARSGEADDKVLIDKIETAISAISL